MFDNVAIPLIIAGASGDDIRRRVSAALDKVGLLDKAKKISPSNSPAVSSSVWALPARWSTSRRCCWRMNRPVTSMRRSRKEFLRLFEEFNRVGVTVLMATHDPGLISSRPYRVLTLSDGHMHGGHRGE